MAKILLAVANATRDPYPVFPIGPSMVAHAARDAGHEVVLWDHLCETARGDSIEAALDRIRPDVIGVSLRNIDNVDSVETELYTDWYAELVSELRSRTDRPIVLGGAGFSLLPERMIEELGADYGVIGEGEKAFCELLTRFENGERPRQRLWRGSAPLSPEEIHAAVRDQDLAAFYLGEGGMLNVQTKRGCPFRCAYCTYPLLEGNRYRLRSPADVVDEIVELERTISAGYIAFTDSVFNDAHGRYLEIAEELVRRDVGIRWMAYFRPERFKRADVELLRRSGLASVEWGTDCTTDATLAAMQKGFTWDEVEESSRMFAAAGVKNAHFVIFAGPGETEVTARQGVANLGRLEDCVVFVFRGVRILPGTAIHQIALEQRVVEPSQDLFEPVFYHSPDVNPKALHELLRDSFGNRLDRIYPPGSANQMASASRRMGCRGPIWDLLLAKGGRRRP